MQLIQSQNTLCIRIRIRDDEIEIDNRKFRLNDQVFLAEDITALRYGFGVEQSLGFAKRTLRIALKAANARIIEFDCKRFLRSKSQALRDFGFIVSAINDHIVPTVAASIAKDILSGKDYPIGEHRATCKLTKKGVCFVSHVHYDYGDGSSEWAERERLVIPFKDVKLQIEHGQLLIGSKQASKYYEQYPFVRLWNAPILDNIVQLIIRWTTPT